MRYNVTSCPLLSFSHFSTSLSPFPTLRQHFSLLFHIPLSSNKHPLFPSTITHITPPTIPLIINTNNTYTELK